MMLSSNKMAVSVLQRTYDESYLTCSTAVYYESQGNETEAMRCWKLALDRIYDHHANRVLPNFTPASETEKALLESVRQLELQCKERIDLLEALRLSRQGATQDDSVSLDRGQDEFSRASPTSPGPGKGWIGEGTIPAVAYTELSRPVLPSRPSLGMRASSDRASLCGFKSLTEESNIASTTSPPLSALPTPKSRERVRTSPDRHTMRSTLRTGRPGDKSSQSTPRRASSKPIEGPGASKAASLAWAALGQRDRASPSSSQQPAHTLPNQPSYLEQPRRSLEGSLRQWDSHSRRLVSPRNSSPTKPTDEMRSPEPGGAHARSPDYTPSNEHLSLSISAAANAISSLAPKEGAQKLLPTPERLARQTPGLPETRRTGVPRADAALGPGSSEGLVSRVSRRKTSSDSAAITPKSRGQAGRGVTTSIQPTKSAGTAPSGVDRRERRKEPRLSSSSMDEPPPEFLARSRPRRQKNAEGETPPAISRVGTQESSTDEEDSKVGCGWSKLKTDILKKLPPGVDEHAARQILNEIVVHGDEVHWSDIAGLEIAKNALREAVVYPFLRPDLFMGLREPARGMLLFGPPGTGKTMLARAVATESKSTFFSISASSLTSKYLGESEKLVRALFVLAKLLAPSIIFVDEIDSLLSKRSGSGEHEATRRIKTEFLIQWSDLQRAAAGREVGWEKDKERGDPNRVLVLAATNLPWVIDEAARRRFVRRQYIPLPEPKTRGVQIRTLLSQQKHNLTDEGISKLVGLTDGKPPPLLSLRQRSMV